MVELVGTVVGVSFRRCGKIYHFDTGELEVFPGDWVVVETSRGLELGQVICDMSKKGCHFEPEGGGPLKPILRKATPEDHKMKEENKFLEAEAFRVGLEKIRKHALPMKLVEVEYTLDQNKIVFYFSAEGRVDFRALVKDLAAVFHRRIELHQIGVRDVAKTLGGIGPCGQPICCKTFLSAFEPVSIKMAKDQGLSLNPVKISGTCGRLMCCLKYEYDAYVELLATLPELEAKVIMPEGEGVIVDLNIPKQTAIVQMPSKARLEFPAEAFAKLDAGSYEIKKGQKSFQKKKKDALRI